jgi:hypothetical protein
MAGLRTGMSAVRGPLAQRIMHSCRRLWTRNSEQQCEFSFVNPENCIEPSQSVRIFSAASGRLFPAGVCSPAERPWLHQRKESQTRPTFSLALAGGIENPDMSTQSISYFPVRIGRGNSANHSINPAKNRAPSSNGAVAARREFQTILS